MYITVVGYPVVYFTLDMYIYIHRKPPLDIPSDIMCILYIYIYISYNDYIITLDQNFYLCIVIIIFPNCYLYHHYGYYDYEFLLFCDVRPAQYVAHIG